MSVVKYGLVVEELNKHKFWAADFDETWHGIVRCHCGEVITCEGNEEWHDAYTRHVATCIVTAVGGI